jgi:hypothetical protein
MNVSARTSLHFSISAWKTITTPHRTGENWGTFIVCSFSVVNAVRFRGKEAGAHSAINNQSRDYFLTVGLC